MLEPNLIKMQSMARDMSDQQLTARLQQNQTNPDPYDYLFASELMQRGKQRAAAAPRQEPSQTTVRDDVVQNAAGLAGLGAPPSLPVDGPSPAASPDMDMMAAGPEMAPETAMMAEGGVIGLDTSPDMFNERYYANGGIVSFQEGGVPGSRGPVLYYKADGTPVYGYKSKPKKYGPEEDFKTSGLYNLGQSSRDRAEKQKENRELWESMTPMERERRREMISEKDLPELSPEEVQSAFGYTAPTSGKQPNMGMREVAEDEEAVTVPSTSEGLGALVAPAAPALYDEEYPGAVKSIKRDPYSLEKNMKDREAIYKAMGVDPEFYAKQEAELGEEEEDIGKRENRENWLAAAQGFLKVAQTPGTLGQAAAAGAQTGLEEYAKSAESIREDRSKLREANRNLQMAKQAQALGDAQGEMQYKEAADRELRAQLNQDIQNEFARNVAEYEMKFNRSLSERELAQQMQIATMDANLKLGIAQMSLQENMNDNEAAVMKDMFNAMANGQMTADKILGIQKDLYEGLTDDVVASLVGEDRYELMRNDPAALEKFKQGHVKMNIERMARRANELLNVRNQFIQQLGGVSSGYSAQVVGT